MIREFKEWLNLDKMLGIFRSGDSASRRIATIGMFDGVHRGHLFLIDFLRREGARRGLTPTVVTFAQHPLSVVRPDDAPPLLASLDEKMALLRKAGIENCVLLDFNEKLRRQSAREFLKLLHDTYAVDTLVIGFNHHMGADRIAGIDACRAIGDEIGLEVIAAPELRESDPDGENPTGISSSVIRSLMSSGDLDGANRLLGHFYTLTGTVVGGHRIGRRLGFPTANLKPDTPSQLIPVAGVYAALATTADGITHKAMVNIGYRPTVADADAPPQLSIEANLLDFLGYLYDETLRLEFVGYLRPEKRFASVEKLKSAIAADELKTRRMLRQFAVGSPAAEPQNTTK